MQVATLGKAISNSDWITDEGVKIKKEDNISKVMQ